MRLSKINFAITLFGTTLIMACGSGETSQTTTQPTEANQQVAGVTYTCPMHPKVVSNEPGKCPKCGMFLEKVEGGAATDSATQHQHEAGDQH